MQGAPHCEGHKALQLGGTLGQHYLVADSFHIHMMIKTISKEFDDDDLDVDVDAGFSGCPACSASVGCLGCSRRLGLPRCASCPGCQVGAKLHMPVYACILGVCWHSHAGEAVEGGHTHTHANPHTHTQKHVAVLLKCLLGTAQLTVLVGTAQ